MHRFFNNLPWVFALTIFMLMTIQLFVTVIPSHKAVQNGSGEETGMFPKRINNVDVNYVPDTTAEHVDVIKRYPTYTDPVAQTGDKRVKIAKFSACPVFHLATDGASVRLG